MTQMGTEALTTDSATNRQRVVLITSSQFWVRSNGLAMRTSELVFFLSRNYSLAVVYLNPMAQEDVVLLQGLGARFELFILAEHGRQTSAAALAQRFRHFFSEASPPAVYLVVQIELSFMLDAIPANGKVLLDTIDLVSDRTQSMATHQVRDHFPLTRDQEINLMRRYDRVICIQQAEYAKVLEWLGTDKVILAPHPVRTVERPLHANASVLGLVASRWHANVDGLKWFIEQVWPALVGTGLRLDVYGYVAEAFSGLGIPGIRFLGFVDDLAACYAQIDIAINPVRYGAGLKIKTLEAMAHGLPLVVSRQGASGLEALAGQAFLVADDAKAFADSIKLLAGDFSLRQSMARAAYSHATQNFGPDQCFRDLARQIECLSAEFNLRDS
jgi:glycosyltransferase involved in cell wall biosynthesis